MSRLFQIALVVLINFTISVNVYNAAIAGTKASTSGSRHKSHQGKRTSTKGGTGNVWERIRLGIRIPRPAPASPALEKIAASRPTTTTTISENANTSATGGASRLSTVIIPKSRKSQIGEDGKQRSRYVLPPKSHNDQRETFKEKYTKLGKQTFSLNNRENGRLGSKEQKYSAKGETLFKSYTVKRIRTRLGLHPELYKDGKTPDLSAIKELENTGNSKTKTGKQVQPVSNISCADFKTEKTLKLAEQGMLPAGYAQIARQCVDKQNASYARVSRFISAYSGNKGYLQQSVERARPYLYHVVDALSKHKMPLDLALLPIVESGYQATALSNMNAAGIWQFIPSTGREYGLRQTIDYDGRLDITSATQAAIRFLSGLNHHYQGDWLLALAAYNCGPGAVDAAIASNREAGLDTDFWSLSLPAETQDYVPRLLALALIFENPSSFGLKLRPVKNEPYFIKVDIDHETDIKHLVEKDLDAIAKLADFDPAEFRQLNAAYLIPTLSSRQPYSFLMPIKNANLLHQSLAFMAQSYQLKDHDRIPDGFLISSLAKDELPVSHNTPLLNVQLDADTRPSPIMKRLAKAAALASDETAKANNSDYLAVHYLDKGESIRDVAEYHGISEEMLRMVNKFKRRQRIGLGQRLLIPLTNLADATAKNKAKLSVLYKHLL